MSVSMCLEQNFETGNSIRGTEHKKMNKTYRKKYVKNDKS
jgi:hypothetical protein